MNVERLHEVALATKSAIDDRAILSELAKIVSALENMVAQPQSQRPPERFQAARERLNAATSSFPTDSFSPAWSEILQEIGGSEVVGDRLRERVQEAMDEADLTVLAVRKNMVAIQQEAQAFYDALTGLLDSLSVLGIGRDALAPGSYEVGMLIPRAAVEDGLDVFGSELRKLDFIFTTFVELTTGRRTSPPLRSVASSDFMVFLEAAGPTAACIATAAERLIAAYRNLLEIKKLKQELADRGLGEDRLEPIKEHSELVMSNAIDDTAQALMDEYFTGDEGRRSEIELLVKASLSRLANRIDAGYGLEVRGSLLPAEDGDEPPTDKERAYADTVLRAAPSLRFMKLSGKPLLSLPEGDGGTEVEGPESGH